MGTLKKLNTSKKTAEEEKISVGKGTLKKIGGASEQKTAENTAKAGASASLPSAASGKAETAATTKKDEETPRWKQLLTSTNEKGKAVESGQAKAETKPFETRTRELTRARAGDADALATREMKLGNTERVEKDNPYANALAAAWHSVESGYANALSMAQQGAAKIEEAYAPYAGTSHAREEMGYQTTKEDAAKKNRAAYELTQDRADRLSEQAAKETEAAKAGQGTIGKLLIDLGVQGVQMGTDIAAGAATGGGALVPMAVRVFGQGAQEARQAGASYGQQLAYGAALAAVETATEKMFDGVAGAYGKGWFGEMKSAKQLAAALDKKLASRPAGRAALKLLGSMAGEGAEELVSGIVNPIAKMIYNGQGIQESYRENFDWSETLYEGLVGALMGGLGGAVELPGNYQDGKMRAVTAAIDSYYDSIEKNGLFSREAQGRAAEAERAIRRLTKTKGQVTQTMQGGGEKEEKARRANTVTESTAINDDPAQHTTAEQAVIEEYKSSADGKMLEWLNKVKTALANGDQSAKKMRLIAGAVKEKTVTAVRAATGIDTSGFSHMIDGSAVQHIEERHGANGSHDNSMQNSEDMARALYVLENFDDCVWEESGGKKRTSRQFRDGNNNPAPVLRFSKKVNGTYYVVEAVPDSADKKMHIVSAYMQKNGGSVTQELNMGYPPQHTSETPLGPVASTDNSVAQDTAEVKTAENGAESAQEPARATGEETTRRESEKPRESAQTTDRTGKTGLVGDRKGLSRKEARSLDTLGKRLGISVEIVDQLGDGEQGCIVNGKAMVVKNSPALSVAAHEATHWMQQTAPEEYSDFRDYAAAEYGDYLETTVREYQEEYRKIGQELTREEALDELAADYAGELLEDEESYRRLVGENRSLARRILEGLRDLIRRITRRGEAAELRKLTEAERLWTEMLDAAEKNKDNKNTANEGGVRYFSMSADEEAGVKEQLRNHQEELNNKKAVAIINDNGWRGMSKNEFRKKLMTDLKKTGYRVENQRIGTIWFDEKSLNRSLDYIQTDAEAAAYQALPQVLKRGIEISGHDNHKGRGYETRTIAAPIELNGQRGNVAVVVKQTKGNRYKIHRILTPEGETFVLPQKANTVPTSAGGITEGAKSSGGVAPAINTVSNASVRRSAENSNTQNAAALEKARYSTDEATTSAEQLLELARREAALKGLGVEPSGTIEERAERWKQEKERRAEEHTRTKTKEEFKGTEALDKLGVKVAGDVTMGYEMAKSMREWAKAKKQGERAYLKEAKRLRATGAEQEAAQKLANRFSMDIFAEAAQDGGLTAEERAEAAKAKAAIEDALSEKSLPKGVRPEAVRSLMEYRAAQNSFQESPLRQRKREIKQSLEDKARGTFDPIRRMNSVSALKLNHTTPERAMRAIFGEETGKKIYEQYFKPVAQNEAEKIRFQNRQLDAVRKIKGSDGKAKELTRKESALTQRYIEGIAAAETVDENKNATAIKRYAEAMRHGESTENITVEEKKKNGEKTTRHLRKEEKVLAEKYADWLNLQDELTSGGKDIDRVRVENAAEAYTERFDQFYDAVNDFLVAHGFEPIGWIRGYAPHMQSTESMDALQKALGMLGIDVKAGTLPGSIAGLTGDFKPDKRWNPYFLNRNGDTTDLDITKAYDSYVQYMSDVLFHTDDIMRTRSLVKYFRERFSPEEIRNDLSWISYVRYGTEADKLAAMRAAGVIEGYENPTGAEVDTKLEEYAEKLLENSKGKSRMNDFIMWLDDYANILAGKQSVASRGTEKALGRKYLNVIPRLVSTFGRAQVMGNLSSALNQTAQLPLIVAENGVSNTARALQVIWNGELRRNITQESDFLTAKRGVDLLTQDGWQKFVQWTFKPLEVMDSLMSQVAYQSSYLKSVQSGMSAEEATKAADARAEKIMGSRAKGTKPEAFYDRSAISQMMNLFQVEALNSWEHIVDDLPREIREIAKESGTGKATKALAALVIRGLLAAFLLNRADEELYGGTPAPFDIGGLAANFVASGQGITTNAWLIDTIDKVLKATYGKRVFTEKSPEKLESFDWETAFSDTIYNISNDIPYVRNISALLGLGDQTLPFPDLSTLGDLKDSALENGLFSVQTLEEAGDVAAQAAPLGRQISKTLRGARTAINQGKMYGSGENEKVTYAVDRSALKTAQLLAFGPNGVSESREHYAAQETGLNDQQTKSWKEIVGGGLMSAEDAFDLLKIDSSVTREKLEAGIENGVSPELYTEYYRAALVVAKIRAAEEGKNTASVSQEDAQKALKLMTDLSATQRAALWQMTRKAWKSKNNPFSTSVGNQVFKKINPVAAEEEEKKGSTVTLTNAEKEAYKAAFGKEWTGQ